MLHGVVLVKVGRKKATVKWLSEHRTSGSESDYLPSPRLSR